jgi:hypothetical protein
MRTTITWRVVLAAILVAVLVTMGTSGPAPVAGARTSAPIPPLYGVTIDRIRGIATVVAAEKSLPSDDSSLFRCVGAGELLRVGGPAAPHG